MSAQHEDGSALRMDAGKPSSRPSERTLLAAARAGDEAAFQRLVEPHHAGLHAHCYRMLASLHDAEDALQETLLKAWRAVPGFDGRSSVRTWLHRIATNACLDAIRRRPKRVLPMDYGPAAGATDSEPGVPVERTVWIDPYPDEELGVEEGHAAPGARYEQREAVELAFIAALQLLPPRQRAVLILRDVLGFSATEVADTLESTVASVNSALYRARKAVDERLPQQSQQTTLRALGDERVREIVERYMDAWERGDIDAIAAMLAEDAKFEMPPYPSWWRGRDVIAAFAAEPVHRYLRTRANGQVANAAYRWDAEKGSYVAEALEVLTLEGCFVKQMTAFMIPEFFPRFGLPDELSR